MNRICFTLNGVRHCIPLPILFVPTTVVRPPPHNWPDLDLALSVMELAKVVPASSLSKQLTEVSSRFVEQLKQQLPKGVEITTEGETQAR